MIRCLIVDDEPLAIRVLEHLLAGVPDVEVVGTSTRPLDAIGLVRERAVDLVFLDIEMPGLTGLDFVRSLADPPHVVFTTAHREHAVEGFELDAIDYLVKPVRLPRLLRALDKVRSRVPRHGRHEGPPAGVIHVRVDRSIRTMRTGEILFAEALGDYVVVHTLSGNVTARTTLTELATGLEEFGFVRVHRSFVVNPAHVQRWTTSDLSVGGRSVPVGRTYRSVVADRMASMGQDPFTGPLRAG